MRLALGFRAKPRDGGAGGMYANLTAVKHRDSQDVADLSGTGSDDFGESGDADSHQVAASARCGLFLAQAGVVHGIEHFFERRRIVAAIVFPAERGLIWELPGFD